MRECNPIKQRLNSKLLAKTPNRVDAFCRKTFSQPVRGRRVVDPQKLRLFKMHFFVAALARKALVGRATCIPIVETNSLGCTANSEF